MAPHFQWIKPHLPNIAVALQRTINDEITAIHQRTAQCIDIVAHSIGKHSLSQPSDEFIEMALHFWSAMLPSITEQLQDINQTSTTKSTLCDALSNIGVHVYERLAVSCVLVIVGNFCNFCNLRNFAIFPNDIPMMKKSILLYF